MENFRPAFILQKDVAVLLSDNGKPIHNTTIVQYVKDGFLPEPVTGGKSKKWSVEELSKKLKISEDRIFETIRKTS